VCVCVMFLPLLTGQRNTDNTTNTLSVKTADRKLRTNEKNKNIIFILFCSSASELSIYYNPSYYKHILLNVKKPIYL